VKPALELTSVPPWAVAPTIPEADLSGTAWTVVAIGPDADGIVETWCAQIGSADPDAAPRVHRVDGTAAAQRMIDADLAIARVGWRLMIAGPADDCLPVRAHAVRNEVADDEITVASTDVTRRTVHCVHCGRRTTAQVALEDTVACAGCDRRLLVYYHVSRRHGAHLGFMVDAERPAATA
jgi:dimethylamine monooxygenase subunit C